MEEIMKKKNKLWSIYNVRFFFFFSGIRILHFLFGRKKFVFLLAKMKRVFLVVANASGTF